MFVGASGVYIYRIISISSLKYFSIDTDWPVVNEQTVKKHLLLQPCVWYGI